MKIAIQASKVIKFIKKKNRRTYKKAYNFTCYGVLNPMCRQSEVDSFTFDNDQSLENFERLVERSYMWID